MAPFDRYLSEVTDVSLFDTATNAASTPVVPQGQYIFECLSVGEQPPYAPPGEQPKPGARPGIKWVFGLYEAASGQRFYFQDDPYEFFQSTTSNMQRGARAREYVEALLGREVGEGENINPNDLIGRKGIGFVIWEISRNDRNKKVAKLASPEPYRETVVASAPTRAANGAATAVMERPSGGGDVSALRETLKKKIRQAEVLQTPAHLEWIALNVDSLDAGDCASFIEAVQADLDA